MLASVSTRPVFWHTGTFLHVLWLVLAAASVLLFAYGLVRPISRWRRGRGRWWAQCSTRELSRRLLAGLRETASHVTIKQRDPLAGWAHAGIFYGWIVLFVGTVVLAFDTDFTDPVFGWNYFHGSFYLAYKEILNVLGTALLAGLLAMMVRRAIIRPAKLDYTRPDRPPEDSQVRRFRYQLGDWAFVGTLLIIALTGFALEGVRIAMDRPGYAGTQFAGWIVAQALTGLSGPALAGLRHGLWWFHGLLAIAFVATIPYTKAMHMLTSFLSLSLRDPVAGKRLQPVAKEPVGYTTLADFSGRHLLQLDACTKCGKCHEACPANATGRPLSPRDVILELREVGNGAADERRLGGLLGSLLHGNGDAERFATNVIGEDRVRPETIWSCMQCNACVEACPVGIEQAPIINELRRSLVDSTELPSEFQDVLQTITRSGNSFGQNRKRRGRWTRELDFDVPDARVDPVDVLWFVGDFASFDPRSQEISRRLARLYREAGVEFGILYDGESNAGNDVRRMGEEGLWEELAESNIETLRACSFRRIVTSDPHSLNTIRREYPDLGGDWTIIHHTALLGELLDSGQLQIRSRLGYRVTYHDPCHLGRFAGEYDAPRRILQQLGCELIEMPRNRANSFCCGAGGGRIWARDQPGAQRPSENRIEEAVSLEEVDLFVVACPKDVVMYEDAIKTSGHDEHISLREISELVAEACLPLDVATSS